MTHITLHIDRLILDGVHVAPGDRAALLAAVEAELTRLLSARGLSSDVAAGGSLSAIRGGALHVSPGGTVEQLGVGIAGAAYSGLGSVPNTAPGAETRR